MTDEAAVSDDAIQRAQARQALAWLAVVQPAEWAQRDAALLSADLGGDDADYRAQERQIIADWREHRDDSLPAFQQRAVEIEQGVAWLGDRLGTAWAHAHALALGQNEGDRDVALLRGRGGCTATAPCPRGYGRR